jgi:hypothetical protein
MAVLYIVISELKLIHLLFVSRFVELSQSYTQFN